jgi:predicted  nucleic acid-binding Zn-ribbon protein
MCLSGRWIEVVELRQKGDLSLWCQAQEQANRLQSEADEVSRRYRSAYSGAEEQHTQGEKLKDHMTKLMHQKAETEAKLAQLQADLVRLNHAGPEEVAKLDAELAALHGQVRRG